MADITLAPATHAHIYVWTDQAIERELSTEFSFIVPGSEYMNRFRRGWDGRIRLYNRTSKLIYAGLATRILAWAEKRGYTVNNTLPKLHTDWSELDTNALLAAHPTPMPVRDYQQSAITYGLHRQRCVLLSPTASGKSLILYYMVRARVQHGPVLLIVPTISLVSQMVEDWREYGWSNVDTFVHKITGGVRKDTEKPVVVSTWQSIFKQPDTWFSRYTSVFGDESHLYKAESLRGIMEKMPHCAFRVGVTGTLDDAKSNKLMVEGVFGPAHRVARTADLQEKGHLTPIRIQGHFLQYSEHDRWFVREHKRQYADEIDFFVQHPGRMAWLTQFVSQLSGNVLVLFQFVDKHGIPLYHAMKALVGDSRPVYYVSGEVSAESRERVRALLEQPEHVILNFGETQLRCLSHDEIPLSFGGTKLAKDITPDDDVADSFILNKTREMSIRSIPTDLSTS